VALVVRIKDGGGGGAWHQPVDASSHPFASSQRFGSSDLPGEFRTLNRRVQDDFELEIDR
jgi:hypothetical protein